LQKLDLVNTKKIEKNEIDCYDTNIVYSLNFLKLKLIFITFLVKPFIIGDGVTNIVVKKGQIIKYDIKYGGEPEPEVKWYVDNKELKAQGERLVL